VTVKVPFRVAFVPKGLAVWIGLVELCNYRLNGQYRGRIRIRPAVNEESFYRRP
jgi:hypothetical protein